MSYKENAFPINKGAVELTSGTHPNGTYWAVEDGSLTVTWTDATTSSVTVPAGAAVECSHKSVTSVTIASGTFHRA